jgi:mono/diheme cytochrome c family protein
VRSLAVPRSARDLRSPIVGTPDVLTRGRRHFAMECAGCHGNDGRGQTEIGKALFPPPPDLRRVTASLSDGEIFYAIENGIRFSAMPAFAEDDPEEQKEHWAVVYFIRHLPDLMPSEIAEMERLNPRPPDQGETEPEKPAAHEHEGHEHGGHEHPGHPHEH